MKRRTWPVWVLIFAGFVSISLGGYVGVTNSPLSFIKAYQATSASSFLVPLVTLLVSLGVGLFTLAGLLLASVNVKWGLSFQSVVKLQEDEGADQQAEAKKLVFDALKKAHPPNTSSNVYSDVRQYIKNLNNGEPKEYEALDKARRHLTTFWYKAAILADLGVIKREDIFYNVGPPHDILNILEPLEAIHIELFTGHRCEQRLWPPMRLVAYWYNSGLHKANSMQWSLWTQICLFIRRPIARCKKTWRDKEGNRFRCAVPACKELYDKSW
jgi:hypothetical protein